MKTTTLASLTALCLMALPSGAGEKKMNIAELDANFRPATVAGLKVNFYDAMKAPFTLEGFPWRKKDGEIFRVPESFTANDINKSALHLANHSTGGEIRFRTNSPYIVLRAKLAYSLDMNHMTRTGSAGFDLYRDGRFVSAAQPDRSFGTLERKLKGSPDGSMCDFILNLPLYGSASQIELGLAPNSKLEAPVPHKITKPILFHGSSITQGGCASRPGNAYTSMLCRKLDAEQINLGFSGSGMAEPALAEAVASLDLSLLVLDAGHTKHNLNFYKTIRKAHPELPIIIVSKSYDAKEKISRATYDYAIANGDKNILFFDGMKFFDESECPDADACTVDGVHPNDLGFYRMYKALLPVLEKALQL
ncbi:MAG: SGNH/GDSL hydrolase family protein [Victivallales bacterium]|nr:SGNH/GDSL hydrolase family protein [Victivallales bacterium]